MLRALGQVGTHKVCVAVNSSMIRHYQTLCSTARTVAGFSDPPPKLLYWILVYLGISHALHTYIYPALPIASNPARPF